MDEASPFALIQKDRHGLEIHAANGAAQKGGVYKGMRLTDARAILPSLVCEPAEPHKDALALKRLALWCRRYTPITAIDEKDGLWLDITGAAHLLGGDEALLKNLHTRLQALKFENRLGLASSPGAAWALARFSPQARFVLMAPDEDPAPKLRSLPIEALRLSDDSLNTLKNFGLKKIGQLIKLPRHAIESRFTSKQMSDAVLGRLDQLLGVKAEPLTPVTPPAHYEERLNFPEPISQTEAFYGATGKLLSALCLTLEKAHQGARTLTLSAYRTDGGISEVTIRTARPSRDKDHLAHLFKDKIETINPGFGIDCLILSATKTAPMQVRQTALGSHKKQGRYDLATLIDRVSNRLGAGVIMARARCESHIPEAAEHPAPPLSAKSWAPSTTPPRPLRLLRTPEPIEVIAEIPDGPPRHFRWRRVSRRIVKASGPERIASEWWHDFSANNRTRDYYTLEDTNGRRYWLFREGLYDHDDGDAPPKWLMHGLFA